jgi:hypothetical protein
MAESIGSTFSIATGEPATLDQAGYEALTFAEVGNVATIGGTGDTHADITPPPDLKTGRQLHFTGAKDGGEVAITIHTEDFADAGQDAVRAANGQRANFSFKIEDPDGNVEYSFGRVVNYRKIEKSATSYEGVEFILRINSDQTIVEA